jgi:hypothetical protein
VGIDFLGSITLLTPTSPAIYKILNHRYHIIVEFIRVFLLSVFTESRQGIGSILV